MLSKQHLLIFLHDTAILVLACLATYTDTGTKTLEVIQENTLIKPTGEGWGCVFLLCDTQLQTFYHVSGQVGNGNHKSHLGRKSKFLSSSPPLSSLYPTAEKGILQWGLICSSRLE